MEEKERRKLSAQAGAASEDRLREETLRPFLTGAAVPLYCLEETDSTNSRLKKLALEGAPHGTVVTAESQTGGRGRLGRSFQSPAGKGIYLSLLLRPTLAPEALLPVTALAAVAVCRAVEQVCGLGPKIKWTNDLVLNGKKICGILTELVMTESGPAVIVGVGLNVHQKQTDFSPEVAAIASSLEQELGGDLSRPELAGAVIRELLALGERLGGDFEEYLAAYRRDCLNLGREAQLLWSDSREVVTVLDVDEQFGLVIRRADGTTDVVRSGEVSIRGLYGYVE